MEIGERRQHKRALIRNSVMTGMAPMARIACVLLLALPAQPCLCASPLLKLPQLCRLRLRGGSFGAAGGGLESRPACEPAQEVSALASVVERMRGVWQLKEVLEQRRWSEEHWVGEGYLGKIVRAWLDDPSALIRHEVCYVLGQTCGEEVLDILEEVLKDEGENGMVRHEAAEALGAVGSEKGLEILRRFRDDRTLEVAETCRIALDRIAWMHNRAQKTLKEDAAVSASQYSSVDPAPSLDACTDVAMLEGMYLDSSRPLFERYRAMFALRDLGTAQAVECLCKGFVDKSSLFRHEIAFVMGQMETQEGRHVLERVLRDSSEHHMVRHEAAEALGASGNPDVLNILTEYSKDPDTVVAESCEVALDMLRYWEKYTPKRTIHS